MKVYTAPVPSWVSTLPPAVYNNIELFDIVKFYVFNTPCKTLSSRSITLGDYGWTSPWSKPFYLNKQLKQASSNQNLLFSAASLNVMDNALQKADLLDLSNTDISLERICIFNNQKNQFMSVFYHIRNSFAHGRFNIYLLNENSDDLVFLLEDVSPSSNRSGEKPVSARMIIRKSTLLKWKSIICKGETVFSSHT